VSHAPASLSDVRSTVLSHAPLAERLRQLPAEADEALSALAEDKNPVVASKAVFVASHRQTTSAGAVVRKGLCHPLPHVRLVAAAALQRIAPSQWGDLRKAIATERDTGVRQLLRQTLKGRAESSLATTKENG
jgi:hypothetical protein